MWFRALRGKARYHRCNFSSICTEPSVNRKLYCMDVCGMITIFCKLKRAFDILNQEIMHQVLHEIQLFLSGGW
jgi:hypothetical protein